MKFDTLDDLDLSGKTVLTRVDLNLPMRDGRIADDTRLQAVLPTIRDILRAHGRPVLLAHFGRPKGKPDPSLSLRPIAKPLADALGAPVRFSGESAGPKAREAVERLGEGEVLLLENTRFHPGEEANDPELARAFAALGDVYVNDAFSAAHRAHASTEGLARLLPAAAGRLMESELRALSGALANPQRPVIAVVGGAKISSKLDLLANLSPRVDQIIIGGGMANTFLAARGAEVGKSLFERDLLDTARRIERQAEAADCEIVLPIDVVVAEAFEAHAPHETLPADGCPENGMILDAGEKTVADIARRLENARTVVWNGPLGAFETPPFDAATVAAARKAAELTKAGSLLSVAGGGDTVSALNHAGVAEDFSYVSTAGGAFLEWLEGKTLPGVRALEEAAQRR